MATRYISPVVSSRLGYRSRRLFPFLLLRPGLCFRSTCLCFRTAWLFFGLAKPSLPFLLLLLQPIQLLPSLFTLKLPTTFWQVNLLRFVHCWNSRSGNTGILTAVQTRRQAMASHSNAWSSSDYSTINFFCASFNSSTTAFKLSGTNEMPSGVGDNSPSLII